MSQAAHFTAAPTVRSNLTELSFIEMSPLLTHGAKEAYYRIRIFVAYGTSTMRCLFNDASTGLDDAIRHH